MASTAPDQERTLNLSTQRMPAVTKGYYIEKIIDSSIVKRAVGKRH